MSASLASLSVLNRQAQQRAFGLAALDGLPPRLVDHVAVLRFSLRP